MFTDKEFKYLRKNYNDLLFLDINNEVAEFLDNVYSEIEKSSEYTEKSFQVAKDKETKKKVAKVNSRDNYKANKERISTYKKQYYIDNKDKVKAKNKEYYEANKERLRKYNREAYHTKKSKLIEINNSVADVEKL